MYNSQFSFEYAMYYNFIVQNTNKFISKDKVNLSVRYCVVIRYNQQFLNWPGINWELCGSYQSSDPGMSQILVDQFKYSILTTSLSSFRCLIHNIRFLIIFFDLHFFVNAELTVSYVLYGCRVQIISRSMTVGRTGQLPTHKKRQS